MHLRSKGFWSWAAAAAVLMLLPDVANVWAQQTPASQQPPPSLTVDRDPVASPDPDAPPQKTTEPPQGIGGGSITKGAGGKYTLRTDAYEVRLNASVLDSTGRTV